MFPKLEEENIEVISKAEKLHSGTWLSGGLDTAGLMVGLVTLKVFSSLNDSLWSCFFITRGAGF